MTKRDFELVAATIRGEMLLYSNPALLYTLDYLVKSLCVSFKNRYPNFDADKFREACKP